MKAIVTILCLWFAVSACQTSKNEVAVPDSIQDAFAQLHPHATDIHWIQEPSIFEAKFTDGNLKGAVSFNDKGEVVETEEVIEQDQLPNLTGILDYIKANYSGEAIQRCEKIVKHDGSVSYELQIKGVELVFDANGEFTSVEPD